MYFQILLQLIRGSSFNSWVRNEIFPNVKKKNLFHLTSKFAYLFIFGCAGSSFCAGFSLVSESRAYSQVAVRGLLTVMAGFSCC